jgi:hypothetical protein
MERMKTTLDHTFLTPITRESVRRWLELFQQTTQRKFSDEKRRSVDKIAHRKENNECSSSRLKKIDDLLMTCIYDINDRDQRGDRRFVDPRFAKANPQSSPKVGTLFDRVNDFGRSFSIPFARKDRPL